MVLDRTLVDGIVKAEKIQDILHHVSLLTPLSSQDINYFSGKAIDLVLDDLLGNKEFAGGILDVIWCVVRRNSLGGIAGGPLIRSLLMLALENNGSIQLLRQTVVCANQILRSKQTVSSFFNISRETSSIMLGIGEMLFNTGDYETQAVILEAVFRLSNPSDRKYWAEKWFQSDQLREHFINFKPDNFELECRKFLNTLNSTQGSSRRVYSFICKSIIFGGYKVLKPYGSDLWVDFNLDSQSVSFYVADLSQDEHVYDSRSLWETIILEKNHVAYSNITFGVNQGYQLVSIQLHRPCADLVGYNIASSLHSHRFSVCDNKVLLMLPEDDIVHSLLQNIYGELHQGQVVASSQPCDDSNIENSNVSELETEIGSSQPFTVSSTVRKSSVVVTPMKMEKITQKKKGQVVASSQPCVDSNIENSNVSELETEIGSSQPFTVSSTVRKSSVVVTPMKMKKNTQREKVNKNILKNSSCNIQLKEGLKSSETSRDLHSSSSEVEVKKSSVSLPKCQFSSISLNSFKTSTPLSASGHLTQIRNGTSDNEKAYPCIPLGVFQHEIQMNQKDVGLMSTAKETQLRNEDLTHKKHTKVKASVILEPFFFGECKERGVGSTSERNDQRNNFHKISNKYSELSPNKVDLTKDPSNTALSGSCSDKVTHSEHVIVSSHDFCNKEVKSACATGKLNSSKDNSWEIMNSSYLHSKESTTARCSNKVTPLKDNSIYQPSTLEPQSLRKNLKVVSKSDEKPLSKDLSSMFNLYASPLKENITEETFFNFDSGNDTVSENSSRKMRDKETEKPLSFIQTSEKNNRSRRVETTTNSELSIAKSLYTTYTEDNGLGSSVSVKTQKYKSKNDVTPEKKAEERCGRISKKTVLQKTVSSFSDAPNGIKQRKHRAAAVKSTAKTKILFQTRVKELVEDNIPYDQPEDEEETAKGKINHCVSKKIQETNRSFNKQILKGKKSFISDTETSSEISWLGGKKRKVNVPKIKHTYEKKNVKAKTTMKIYSSTIIENSQNKEAKGNSHFGLEGRMYPPLKFSKAANMYNITSSLVEPEDLEVIWPSQKEQRKYSLGREMDRKSRKLINRKSSGTDWSDIENFEATEEPSSVSETKMKLSRSNSKIKNAQQKLTQLVSETFHNNAGINVSDIKSVNMVSNSDELSTKKDSTVLSNSLEETRRNLICGKETDIAHRKNKCKDLYGLAIEDLSGKMKQKARFVTEPESVNLGRENRESLNFNNKSAADLIVNKSKQKFNSICIQEEEYYKQHGIYNNTTLEKNCNVRHDASHIRYPNHSSSSNEPVSLASFKQSLSEELQKKSWILLQKLVLLEQLRSNPFKWRESLSDLDSPDIVPPNNSPETDFISSPVDRSERFNLNTTWANLEHKKYLMITKPGLYTPTQEVQSQRNAKLSEMDATVEPDDISYVPDSQKRRPSSVICPQESVLKRKCGSLENEPEPSLIGVSRKRHFTPEMARGSPGLEDDLNFCSPQSISSYLKDLKSSSPASFSLSFLKTMASPKYPSIQDQETYPLLQSFSPKNQKTLQSPKSSYFQNQKKEQIKDFDINIKGTKPSFSETDISPPKQRIGRATIHRVEEQICPSMLNFQSGRKQQAVDSPVINYCRTNFVFPDVKSEVVPRKLEEQVKALSKKYINTIQRCISTFNNQLAEYKEQVFEVIAEITDENHAAFQVNCDLLTYMKESKNHRLKLVHKFAKLEEKVQLLRLAENKLEEKLKEIQKKATLKYQQELQRVKEEFYTEMEKSVLKQLHHHLSTFNLFI